MFHKYHGLRSPQLPGRGPVEGNMAKAQPDSNLHWVGGEGDPPFATNEQPWYSSFPTPDLGPGRTVLFDGEKSVGPLG